MYVISSEMMIRAASTPSVWNTCVVETAQELTAPRVWFLISSLVIFLAMVKNFLGLQRHPKMYVQVSLRSLEVSRGVLYGAVVIYLVKPPC